LSVLSDVVSGAAFTVTVTARDNAGNLAENFGSNPASGTDLALVNLTAAVAANGQSAFDAAVAPSFAGGVATFAGLKISNAADGYSFNATATSASTTVNSPTSTAFNVTFKTLTVGPVASVVAGAPFTVTVTATDNNGANAENFGND